MEQRTEDPSAERWSRIRRILADAVELAADERTALLDRRCGDDTELRREIETLIAAHGESDGREFFGVEDHPEQIGPYKILSPVARGGMGEVYLAEQQQPIRRRVALKLIQVGMDTREVIARFEAERQALALMDHPSIARVLDAGATERGRPYFAMEYVPGEPITRYADRHRLDTRERLELLIQVCDGVQHAHHKGVIHRDLKPSNVLVTVDGDRPVPKIIDFGIAKATDRRLTEKTVFTKMGVLMGTPEYMSPEQAEMTGLDVDTRTDVYSLGVMLYELLAGELPFDSDELREAGFDEIRRRIREDEPPRPSTKLSTRGERATQTARNRKTRVGTLIQDLRGDLDWITMKALEKDRTRRYGSPGELAADLLRHLGDEPVVARPPSAGYRLRKFARRNRAAVVTGGLVAAALVAGLIGTSYGLARSIRAERQARQDAATATEVSRFLVDLFKVADPGEARGSTITAREVLDRSTEEIGNRLDDQPRVRARLMDTMAEVYLNLGLLEPARDLRESALEVRLEALGEDHVEVADSRERLGAALQRLGDLAGAREQVERSLASRERRVGPDDVELIDTLTLIALVELLSGKFDGAERQLDRAEGILERTGDDDLDARIAIAEGRMMLAGLIGDFDAMRPLTTRLVELTEERFGHDSPELVQSLENQASSIIAAGRDGAAAAIELQQRALDIQTEHLGPDHPDVAPTMFQLGAMRLASGDRERGWKRIQDAIALQERTLGEQHPELAKTLGRLAQMYLSARDPRRAIELLERVLTIREAALGAEHQAVAETLGMLAEAQRLGGDYPGGIRSYRRALEIWERRLGPDHPQLAQHLKALANLRVLTGDPDGSRDLLERALAIDRRVFEPGHPAIARGLQSLAMLQAMRGEYEAATELLEQAIEGLADMGSQTEHGRASMQLGLANVHAASGARQQAAALYEEVLSAERRLDEVAWRLPYAEACHHAFRGDVDTALEALRQAVDRGYPNVWMNHDPGLLPLHGRPEFDALVRVVYERNGLAAP